MYDAWHIEDLSLSQVRCMNALFGGRLNAELSLPSGTWICTWLMADDENCQSFSCLIHGQCGNQPWQLWLDDYTVLCPEKACLTPEILSTMSAELMRTALNIFAESLLDVAKNFVHKEVIIQGIDFSKNFTNTQKAQGFAFVLSKDAFRINGFLEAPYDGHVYTNICAFWQQEKPVLRNMHEIPVRCTPILESFTLPLKEIKNIQIMDCILGMHKTQSDFLEMDIRCCINKNKYLHAKLSENALTISANEGFHMQDDSIDQYFPQATANADEQDKLQVNSDSIVDNIPLRIDFALDPIELNVGKLARLKAGEVFVTHCNPQAPINIFINGQSVGTGKLVNVAGRIGVQVLEMKGSFDGKL